MGAGVATVGRRAYAVGLYWENSPIGRVVQAAKEAAKQPGQQADYYAVRAGSKDGRVPQFGLGQASAGHKAGMPSFAGCLANQQPGGSWAGAFKLREGTVVVVVRDELIVPDGDQFFLTEADARERLLQEIGFGGLQRVYAPESWAIPGADSMPVSLLLDERRDVALRIVSLSKQHKIIAGAVVGVLVVAVGIGWYIQHTEEVERERLAEIERQNQLNSPLILAQSNQPVYPPPERKWEKAPHAMDVVESCRMGLAKVPVAIVGWNLATLRCDGISISLGWTHNHGVAMPPPGAAISDNGATASLSIPLPALTPRGDEALMNPADLTRIYLAQNWPGNINRTSDDPPPPPPPGFQGQWSPPAPPWVKRSFTLTIRSLPNVLPALFGDLPGALITSMSLSPGSSLDSESWTVEGVIYENRI